MIITGVFGGLIVALFLAVLEIARVVTQRRHESNLRLRDERIRAYREMLRITAAIDPVDLQRLELTQVYSGAQLLTGGESKVLSALEELHNSSREARERANEIIKSHGATFNEIQIAELVMKDGEFQKLLQRSKERRDKFLQAAWRQLGVEPQKGHDRS